MISFNLTALTQPTLSIQRKSKTRDIFPQENLSQFYPIFIHIINVHTTQLFQFTNSLNKYGSTPFQKESDGWDQHTLHHR